MIHVGVRGGKHHASVDDLGRIELTNGSPVLDWHVADEKRWHSAGDPTEGLRQVMLAGTPVVETKMRVQGGDVVQRVWAVADHGGLVVVEFENDSPASVAVALTRGDLITSRPVPNQPIPGIDLPEGSIALPLGHRSTLRVALPFGDMPVGVDLAALPSAVQVSRGWLQAVESASRLVSADAPVAQAFDEVNAARCELLVCGIPNPADDPLGALIGGIELVRLGENPYIWIDELVPLAEQCLAGAEDHARFMLAHAVAGLQFVLAKAGEPRAVRDVARAWSRVVGEGSSGWSARTPLHIIANLEQQLLSVRSDNTGVLLPRGIPHEWRGINFEAHGLCGPAGARVGFALRWHGENAAVLWETSSPDIRLVSGVDATWSSAGTAGGDALWSVS
jgi:hypothetical protein